MLSNMEYYKRLPKANDDLFIPRPVSKHVNTPVLMLQHIWKHFCSRTHCLKKYYFRLDCCSFLAQLMSFYDVNRFERRIVNLLAEASSSQFYLQHMEPVLCVHHNKIYSCKQQKIDFLVFIPIYVTYTEHK
jgi:hypothetical protein